MVLKRSDTLCMRTLAACSKPIRRVRLQLIAAFAQAPPTCFLTALRRSLVAGQRQFSGRRRSEHPMSRELGVNALEHLAKFADEPVVDGGPGDSQLAGSHVNEQSDVIVDRQPQQLS